MVNFWRYMPSLHLLRSSYDGLVYYFPCDLGGIVGGYGLRFYVYIIYGHRAISCIGHRRIAKDKAVQRLYGDRTEIVRWSCGYHTILRFLYDAFLLPCWKKNCTLAAWSTQGLRTMTLRSYDATYDVFKGYNLTILENLYNSALNKIVEATETVNPYEIVRSSYATPGRSCD